MEKQLDGIHTDKKGGFELSELDFLLKRDQTMKDEGIEYARPIIFDLLPLVAKTVDAHSTVSQCLDLARERDAKIERDHVLAMRRVRGLKSYMRSPVARLAAGFGVQANHRNSRNDLNSSPMRMALGMPADVASNRRQSFNQKPKEEGDVSPEEKEKQLKKAAAGKRRGAILMLDAQGDEDDIGREAIVLDPVAKAMMRQVRA